MKYLLWVCGVLSCVTTVSAARKTFTADFSPQEGFVKAPELAHRRELCLNGAWRFQPVPIPHGYEWDKGILPDMPEPAADKWDAVPIKIPSPWNANHWGNGPRARKELPYAADSVYYPSYPEHWMHYHMAWMERTFSVPEGWPEAARLALHFESVAGECQVWVNGRKVGEHVDKYLPFDIDITEAAARDRVNTVRVGVRSYRLFDKRHPQYDKMIAPYPNGSNTDRLAGIWQDVSLVAVPAVRVEDVFVKPWLDRDTLEAEVTLRNDTPRARTVALAADVSEWVNAAGESVLEAPVPRWRLGAAALALGGQTVTVPARATATVTLSAKPAGRLRTWTPAAPNLYAMLVHVDDGGTRVDTKYQRFGWRQFTIKGRDLLLNGAPIQLKGDIIHPFGAYIYSRRFAWSWYRMIKDMHGNAVRPHAQVYPRFYIELADEMGICVLDETAVFGSSIRSNFAEPAFWSRYADHYKGLIRRDRNSPSVMGWSFGNEMFAIFRLNNVSKEDEKRWYGQLSRLGLDGAKHDPTRPWISCDGDDDLFGTLPVWSKHYGHNLPPLAEHTQGIDKPLMVGENGGTYYARPADLTAFAGELAYHDYAGRNDALGVDVYQNIVKMVLPNKLAYFSASETVWFGLEHLPFGYSDFTRLPTLDDGVFFEGVSGEGKFGMQVERMPPYVAPLNPGWDAALPLYKPLGMFLAQQAAQDPRGPQPCKWEAPITPPPRPAAPAPALHAVACAGGDALKARLAAWGVSVDNAATRFLVIDGAALPGDAKTRAQAVLANSGTVLVMAGGDVRDWAALSALLPHPVAATPRTATALERGDDSHPWAAPFGLADLYFAEEEPEALRRVMRRGLDGAFVKVGKVALTASRTDWALFNRRSEEEKMGSIFCYEQVAKPNGAALVTCSDGGGTWAVCAIDETVETPARAVFWRRLFNHMGVKTGAAQTDGGRGKREPHDLLLDGPQH